jgi:hypothetical protein
MELAWPSQEISSISQVYQIEFATTTYFSSLINAQALSPSDSLLDLYTSITNGTTNEGTITFHGIVTATYLAQQTVIPLNSTLTALTQQDALLGLQRALASEQIISEDNTSANDMKLTFSSYGDPSHMTDVLIDTSRSSAAKSLIIGCALLAVALLVVSNVLLYVTGGWNACRQSCNSCLFEEVEDDYAVAKMSTFQVQSYDEGERSKEEDMEAQSVVTDNPDGMLGSRLAGLGIQTPMRGVEYDDLNSMTPMSEMQTPAPLGIQSMRKLAPPESPDVQGGLSNMIMKRLKAPRRNDQ